MVFSREAQFQREVKRTASAKPGWPSFTVEIPLSSAEREYLASSANLTGAARDDDKFLGNALKALLKKEMEQA